MCRLFGFRAVGKGQLHRSLLAAENALAVQSSRHRDGWGIAYYLRGVPHVLRGVKQAAIDPDFSRLGSHLSSETVIAHLRRATQGEISLVNCHPFQFGRWIMAHNGELPEFHLVKRDIEEIIDDDFLTNVFGTTDSEIYFALFLHELNKLGVIDERMPSIQKCAAALRAAVDRIESIYQKKCIEKPRLLNAIISNGDILIGYRNGHGLCFSSHKSECADREQCAFAGNYCFSPIESEGARVPHLMFCSEPLTKEGIWQDFAQGQIVALDAEFRLFLNL